MGVRAAQQRTAVPARWSAARPMTDTLSPISPPSVSLAELRKHRKALRDVNKEQQAKLTPLTRLAMVITEKVGTMGFFLLIFGWTVIWLGWNTLLPTHWRFDPAMGFVLYLFLCNVIQILLMPLIMVGQNIQGAHAEARAEHDLDINVKAEKEIEVILEHLEYQNDMLLKMMAKLNVDVHQAIGQAPGAGPAG